MAFYFRCIMGGEADVLILKRGAMCAEGYMDTSH